MTFHSRALLVLLALAVFLAWTFMLVHAVRLEEREAIEEKGFMLNAAGEPVMTYGRVWELGRGERPATKEESEWDERKRR